jgi:putative IMPACT (imprinted ancient) family translation regulator
MADISAAVQNAELSEQEATGTIYQPGGDAYLAPDGKTECTITVLGKESTLYRRADDAITRRALRSGRALTPEELRQNRIDRAAAVVTRWYGWEMDGQPAECERDNVRKLLRVQHILEQVEALIEGHAAFFRKSSGS